MTNYAYTQNIPASNHNPSVDQSSMLTNTNSISSLIGEDHYTFGVANGGFHKQMRIPALAAIGNVAPRISNSGTLWTQVNTSVGASQETNLHYIPGIGSNDYQLTRCIAGFFPQFATGLTYGAPPDAGRLGGWTFLPGGMLLQYGTQVHTSPSPDTTIVFPITFVTVFSITTGGQIKFGANESRADIGIVNQSTTGFTAHSTTSSDLLIINWMAIGV